MNNTQAPLTTREVAARFNVDRQTILLWVKAGKIKPIFRMGTHPTSGYAFDRDEIDRLAKAAQA